VTVILDPRRALKFTFSCVSPHAPIIPIALNSGVFWPRHTFFKKSGIIDVVILPPLLPDKFLTTENEKSLLQTLENTIEMASSNLIK
jgi:1-acyl-sn-glycerol-3-phosphate acyltransferase